MDDAHGAVDDDAAGLLLEVVGDEAPDLAEGLWIPGHIVVDDDGFLGVEVGSLGGAADERCSTDRSYFHAAPPRDSSRNVFQR